MRKISSLEEIQKIELDILQEIDNVCRKNKLTYYLAGGTLLGAIRHKGMIPWDNDIDISMPREDYNTLLSIWGSVCKKEYYKVRTFGQNNYYIPFAKIEDRRTLLKQNNSSDSSEIGLFVDIFPIDAYGSDINIAKKTIAYINNTCGRITRAGADYENISLLSNCKQLFWKLFYSIVGKKRAYDSALKPLQDFDKKTSKYVASTFGLRREKELMDKTLFESTIEVEFEGHKYFAPIGYDAYLKAMYGDYRVLPSVQDRKVPHEFDAYWLEGGEER